MLLFLIILSLIIITQIVLIKGEPNDYIEAFNDEID